MTEPNLVELLLLSLPLFGMSALIAWALQRVKIVDIPNARSSHDRPMPRIGGLAVVAPFFVGVAAIGFGLIGSGGTHAFLPGFAAAGLAVAVAGGLDDFGRLTSARAKFIAQLAAALVFVLAGISFRGVSLPYVGTVDLGWAGLIVTVFWLVALTNAVNFMDGLDGIAAGTAIIAAIFFAWITYVEGAEVVPALCIMMAATSLGFLIFNFPRASIFMGDVGSQFLGFTFAALAVIAAEHDGPRTSLLVMPLLFFHFIFDTFFTFVRRLVSNENVSQAHRTHLYQLLNQLGLSHARVSLLHFAVTALQGVGALILVGTAPDNRLLVFIPFLVLEMVYAAIVTRLAVRRCLLRP